MKIDEKLSVSRPPPALPLDPLGALPLDPLGALPPDPRLALHALAKPPPPLADPVSAPGDELCYNLRNRTP